MNNQYARNDSQASSCYFSPCYFSPCVNGLHSCGLLGTMVQLSSASVLLCASTINCSPEVQGLPNTLKFHTKVKL